MRWRRLLAWVCCALGSTASAGEWPRELKAYRGATPVTDGVLAPSEWEDATRFEGVSGWTSEFTPTTRADDLSLRGWVKYDAASIHFAFDVTDDVLYGIDTPRWLPEENPRAHELTREGWPWFGDEMELLVNASNVWRDDEDAAGNGSSWQMVCNLTKSRLDGAGAGGLLEGEPRSDERAWNTYRHWIESGAMRAAAKPKIEGKGYTIEWAIQFNPCLETAPGVFFRPTDRPVPVGLNIAVGDLDEAAKGAGNFGHFHHEEWFAGEKGKRTNVRQWGTLWLMPDGQTPFPEPTDSPSERDRRPFDAAEAARRMRVPEGFRVTVFASEPDVRNPIAMAWDDRGRIWIAENYTYSDGSQRFDLTLRDRVLILEDNDGDGRADQRKVFLDSVQMLTSVEVGRGGVWLLCPPRLLFVPDADTNGVPDGPPRVVLDGFDVARDNYHNFANGLRWGPDGWLYGRCGHSCPGKLGVPGTPDAERVPIDGGIWRFDPERNVVEVLCHGTVNPWGHDWDANGELFFINTVIGHLWHAIPGSHFKESFGESQNVAVYERMDTIADHYHFDVKGGWSASRDGKANERGGGHAHIGMAIYQGTTWPEAYRGRLMTLNMHGLRVNVDRLERLGAGFVGRHEPDFLIAEDPFFRGIDLSMGPDGNVFVLDWSDIGECHEHDGIHRTSGRIYKVSYGETRASGPVVKPACLAGGGRLPRLWKAYQGGRTTPDALRGLLRDPDESMRVWAIRLLTDHWPLDTLVGPPARARYPEDDVTRAEFIRMAREDDSGLVLLVLASTLQRLAVPHRPELAIELVRRSAFARDPALPFLVWYGLMPVGDADPEALVRIARECRLPAVTRWTARNLASRIDAAPSPIDHLLRVAETLPEDTREGVVEGLVDAMRGRRKVEEPAYWSEFVATPTARRAADRVRELSIVFGDGRALDEIRQLALDGKAEFASRARALESLIEADPEDLRAVCEALLDTRGLNTIAMRGLARFDDPEIGRRIAARYARFHPDDRPAVLELLASRPIFATALLDALAAGRNAIPRSDLKPFHVRQIHALGDAALRDRLKQVWGEVRETPEERRRAIESLQTRLTPDVLGDADLTRGVRLFQANCALCHVLRGEGRATGPDLTGAQRSNLNYLLEHIIDPSAIVGKDYRMSVVGLRDGRVLNGLVVSRNDRVLTLQTATRTETIPMSEVESTRETPQSAMPDGLLDSMALDEIRDLIAYLMSDAG
ncbi:MAG: c-type cytochrome [Planctomycetes bacterium]|nr:c-type cytochrome [Planctomycetota bacterium]